MVQTVCNGNAPVFVVTNRGQSWQAAVPVSVYGTGVDSLPTRADASWQLATGQTVVLLGSPGTGPARLVAHQAGFLPFDRDLATVTCAPPARKLASSTWWPDGPGTRTATPDANADAVTFDYSAGGASVDSHQSWDFATTASQTSTLAFDWNYSSFHPGSAVFAKVTAFADGPNGTHTVVLYERDSADVWDVGGTSSLDITKGFRYGFLVEGRNLDSDARLVGKLKITAK
jgi:hypothetical protein